ncbi:MAG: 30S ribosome-binding factor RbfA [Dehalococcoidia bacterium]|nr:30S ribosome-binding factor RbfA [Dehalococcoidia bacterium]
MSRRTERVNDLIREELSDLLLREVNDPRLGGLISITKVEVTPDLYNARVFVSIMQPPAEQTDALRALNAAASFFHRELKSRIQMRRIPFLVFKLDTSIEEAAQVLARIDQALRDDQTSSAAAPPVAKQE